MKIISYNVNGIRAAINKGFIEWLQQANPDVICLQEIKATQDQIPVDDIKGFQLYCVDDADFAVSLNTKNKTMSMFLITDLARKYLKIIENEKYIRRKLQ